MSPTVAHVTFKASLLLAAGHPFDTGGTEAASAFADPSLGEVVLSVRKEAGPEPRRLQVTLSVALDPDSDDDAVRERVGELLEGLCTQLATTSRLSLRVVDREDDLRRARHAHAAEMSAPGEIRAHIEGRSRVSATISAVRVFDPAVAEQTFAASQAKPASVVARMFRTILSTDDPVARFVLAYGMLAEASKLGPHASEETQERVDLTICDLRKGLVRTPHKRRLKNGKIKETHETVFTAIRNELAHFEDRTLSLDQAVTRATAHAGDLVDIAHEYIATLAPHA